MRAGQAGPALGVKAGLVAPVTVRVYFTRPRAGTDRTNGRSWSNQKPLHRGSRPRRPFAPNQAPFKEDRSFIGKFEAAVAHYAERYRVDAVLCGHIHSPAIREFGKVTYYNCGDWVESCTALVEDEHGIIALVNYDPFSASQPAASPTQSTAMLGN